MPKKIKENLNKIKWNTPPFSRVIKISYLNEKKNNQFKINLIKNETISLVKFLDIRSLNSFKCIINLVHLKDKWEINGQVFINCTLQCVISLEDLNYKLQLPFKRYLSSNINLQNNKIINYENINCDTDPLTENVDLGDIVSEEIYLAIPKYPKKSGVKLKNILVNQENSELNPFQKLENLKI